MLRELVDIAAIEDFVAGLARAAGRHVGAYDSDGSLIAQADPRQEVVQESGQTFPLLLPAPLQLVRLPAKEPPISVAAVRTERDGVFVVAPIHLQEQLVGFTAAAADDSTPPPENPSAPDSSANALPAQRWLQNAAARPAIDVARWAARTLAEWCRQASQLDTATQQLALISDIGDLLSGQHNVQRVLDRIVTETARVMNCRYCSLRLYDPATGVLRVAAVHNLSGGYASNAARLRSDNPIDDEALSGRTIYIENAQNDPRIRNPEEVKQMGIVSGLITGMFYQGQPIGVLRIYAIQKRRFRTIHRHLLRAVAAQAATAIAGARLLEERLRTAETERQVQLAGQLQARMMRTPPPVFAPLRAALVFDPSGHVGGDFCDFFLLPDGRLAVAIADVVGHGVRAGLIMTYTRGALRSCAQSSADLGELMNRLNQQLAAELSAQEFVTICLLAIDPQGRRLSWCSAGHEPILLLRDAVVRRIDDAGLVAGIDANEQYLEKTLPLQPGDFLFLYTDGAIESENFEGAQFGRERLMAATEHYGALEPEAALKNIHWDIRRFIGFAEQTDDITMVGLRVLGIDALDKVGRT